MFLCYRTSVSKATQTKERSQTSNEMRNRSNRQCNTKETADAQVSVHAQQESSSDYDP